MQVNILEQLNRADVKQIYKGKDRWCRCGCGGNYESKGTKGFARYIKEITKCFNVKDLECDEANDVYMNLPIPSKNNRCYCVYFK